MESAWSALAFEFEGFEWDDQKARSNLQEHHIDFEDAVRIFSDYVVAKTQGENHEIRWQAPGLAQGRELLVVFVEAAGYCRIISARRCTRAEAKRYYEILYR